MDSVLAAYLQKVLPSVPLKGASAVLELSKDGATVPFIARYRKDKTGNLDEVEVRSLIEAEENFQELQKRKAFITKEIHAQGNLTDLIKNRIAESWELGELEEIYRPYKKKRKTRATLAREAGLGPLADWIWGIAHQASLKMDKTLEVKAKDFLNVPAGFVSYEIVLKGAQDIIVENLTNQAELRAETLSRYLKSGQLASKRAKGFKPNSKYEMYSQYEDKIGQLLETRSSHRYLAMRRGWQEEELALEFVGPKDECLRLFERAACSVPNSPIEAFMKECAEQALSVYVLPSIFNELHRKLKEKADADAVNVFALNLRKLLLASPLGPKVVLGVDPGLKTGCKVALVDKSGAYITHTVLHTQGEGAFEKAKTLFAETLKQIKIEAIAVGNGTAGRQTEVFLRKVLTEIGKEIPVVMVSESGASVYSASDVAREEFPELDLTVRGAISIARRLQDPLAELVKVDPQSIGVGQYQHDVQAGLLKKSLDSVVESCVNGVGVDLNTASERLLAHVSGIGPALAKNIIGQRRAQLFSERSDLLKVPQFSTKAFELSAGFLRIREGKVFLDSTGIHPERYVAIRDMAAELGVGIQDLVGAGAQKLVGLRTKWMSLIGEHTFDDIVRELEKPGRDPRDPFKVFQFRDDIFEVSDLKEGMICPGIVSNVTNFGAFVDIGVHQDGLVHISELSHKFVEDPRQVVNPGDIVKVRVLAVDLARSQISLSMKLEAPAPRVSRGEDLEHTGSGSARRGPQPAKNRGAGDHRSAKRPSHEHQRDGRFAQASRNSGDHKNRQDNRGHGGRPDPRPRSQPFNNPFAALQNIGGPEPKSVAKK